MLLGRRTIPDACPVSTKAAQQGLTRNWQVHLVTPMFGGGAVAKETGGVDIADGDLPVRATSIRGHLRFWWRATRGTAYGTIQELRRREVEVWGNTDTPSPVLVRVPDYQLKRPTPCAEYKRRTDQPNRFSLHWKWSPPAALGEPLDALPYVAFPFQGKPPRGGDATPEEKPADMIPGGKFELEIRFPLELQQDVEAALWGWLNFGGLGARTRRGCGSLYCKDFAPGSVEGLNDWLAESQRRYGWKLARNFGRWPMVGRGPEYKPRVQHPWTAWNEILRDYRDFRQKPGFARNNGKGMRPGRSRYPEPEAIRNALTQRASSHQRLREIPDDGVPRAALGLPIIFHFKDSGERPTDDPVDTMLVPLIGRDAASALPATRMASPLILKPLAISPTQAVPSALIIMATGFLQGAKLVRVGEDPESTGRTFAKSDIVDARFARDSAYPNSPLDPKSGGYAVTAFLNYILTADRGYVS